MADWTVLIPTFNGVRFVGAALATVQRQTTAPAEVLVVDAGSNDGTVDYLRALARDWPTLRIVQPGGRLTAPQARNIGLAQVQTPLLASLDQDDLMAPNRLQLQSEAFAAEKSLTLVGGRLTNVNEAGVPIGSNPPTATDPDLARPSTNAQLRWSILYFCPTLTSSQSFRADHLKALGGFDEAHPLIDDYPLLARIVDHGSAQCLSAVVGGYRRHSSMTSRMRRRRQFREGQAFQWRLIGERLGVHPELDDVTAFVKPSAHNSPTQLRRGRELADQLLAEALAQPGIETSDREWIKRDFDRRLESHDQVADKVKGNSFSTSRATT